MIKLITLLKLCIIGTVCYSQNYNPSSMEFSINFRLDDSIGITITTPRLLRYLPYSFNISSKDTNDILIEGKNIRISKDYMNSYRMNIGDSIFNGGTLTFYRISGVNKLKLGEQFIPVYEPSINVRFANKSSGNFITLEELENDKLVASIDNFDIDLEFPVKSFKLLLTINANLIETEVNGNRLNDEQIRNIKNINKGHPIIFKDIIIEKRNGVLMKMEPLVYFIKYTTK